VKTWTKPVVTDQLVAENKRLREALRLIAGQHMAAGGSLRPEEALLACQMIAERALKATWRPDPDRRGTLVCKSALTCDARRDQR
jgi:hypothetical protein